MVAIVVTTDTITLYDEHGGSYIVKQGHPNVPHIINEVAPRIDSYGYAMYDHEGVMAQHKQENVYTEFEKQSGVVKFFSIAKRKLKSLFNAEEKEPKPLVPTAIGTIPTPDSNTCAEPSNNADLLKEVMQHATPSDSCEFTDESNPNSDDGEDEGTTVIAVVDDKIIPDVQHLNRHLDYANASSSKAMENFLSRISKVIDNRRHSVEDLMQFLRTANLPIADDGRIIAYKNLTSRNANNARFVDIHSRKVSQDVGWIVCVPEHLVDQNRRRNCSNGLHVANPSYLHSFTGDVCVMVKVAPEDFFAVPQYNTNKARVCRYDILALLTDDQKHSVHRELTITNAKGGKELLAKAMRGDFDRMHTRVEVTQHNGNGLSITPINTKKAKHTPQAPVPTEHKELSDVAPVAKHPETAPVNPKQIAEKAPQPKKRVAKQKVAKPKPPKATKPAKSSPRADLLALLGSTTPETITQAQVEKANELRKQAKKSFKALGIDDKYIKVLMPK